MRNARTPLREGRRRLAALLIGGFCCCFGGCHQHHYYYNGASAMSPCPPGTGAVVPSNVTVGPVCEVPDSIDGATVVGSRSTVIDDGRSKPRVVVSEPQRSGSSSRYGWRSTNPEDVPTFTQIEGAVNTTVK
ncbi:hypothetical protein [Paludisphaera mucosa]|uniref:Lipoprotein n=1 Tax=Paludisphaera mucosa TaxID=3030827 RepID=A0ABT6FHI1_9BACT|nr:hypothetical protein [Paludisphaera mucosa]MDG3006850.1 hypothetical protein [Paludisphaera mucosa]